MGWLLKLASGNPLILMWVALGIAAASFASGATTGWKLENWRASGQIEKLNGEIERLKGNVRTTKQSLTSCLAAVETQNAALDKAKVDSEVHKKRADEAEIAARKQALTHKTEVEKIKAAKKAGNKDCTTAWIQIRKAAAR